VKLLSTLLVASGLLFSTIATAQSEPLDLQVEWFSSNATNYDYEHAAHLGGSRSGDTYYVYADFYLESEVVENATLTISWCDPEGPCEWDGDETGWVDGDSDVSMLDANITLPPGATGIVGVEFCIYFADGTYINDFRFVEIE
jgi:hypothetical protein